ncbi:hypothetical protein [Gorillibacterium sp. sgz5001074]|uniref:hypothetical protein n=1 Tax=Gorillibacterium sp. sgz5001074 TaxID=3446695 RepID=UPI003F662F48
MYMWDKMGCRVFPMWMERVFAVRRKSEGWKTRHGTLEEAITKGDYRAIRELVSSGSYSVETLLSTGITPLLHALQMGDRELARLLLSLGARVLEGNPPEQNPLAMALQSGDAQQVIQLLEAVATDTALALGMIPSTFGLGEWDWMWEGGLFFLYHHNRKAEPILVGNQDKLGAMRISFCAGVSDEKDSWSMYLTELRRILSPYGFQIWGEFDGWDLENERNETVEMRKLTFFHSEDKWLAFELTCIDEDRMPIYRRALLEWDERYGIIFEELDVDRCYLSFLELPENREEFWEEAFRIFPKTDDLDSGDADRRRKRFISSGYLELLLI